ncbi:hypothetical protein GH741_03950 [Aquibacillus halophilus]|uniref:Alpha/beta hydrolase n=1 Tax=Aquibacillus halophilus TaxID=930132 RepID=A0A6A8D8A6_9BACI|nr:hypothetical protein [Aquibacillus halophilus]MRH41824.1 hypothetical protein [Aquibacillus halophilus]
MNVTKESLFVDEKELSYTHIKNGQSQVCFMLSGASYTYDKPLFYYTTMMMLEENYDVIHIHYSYQSQLLSLPVETLTEITSGCIAGC